ncbi:MAG TPA: redox-regulated ATPase YchF [Candidatus Paceibacterota bacterium]|nr:redox-regulated ATPase YchF [Candidatus Paceibacterota bacterium]
MNLSIGIVGLPNVGKSTLFNALTRQSVDAANYPFCTIDPSVGIVEVPDERLGQLSVLSNSARTIPAAVQFVDIAGLVKGASEGQGLGNQFLSHIREVDAIAQVVRIFEHADIIHVAGHIDPVDDIQVINLELVLADLAVVNKRLSSVEKDVRAGLKEAVAERDGLVKVKAALEGEKFARTVTLTEEEEKEIRKLNLLTAKKMLYVLNVQSGGKNLDELPAYAEAPAYANASAGRSAGKKDERWEKLIAFLNEEGATYVIVDAALESDLNAVADAERTAMRESLAVRGGIDSLIIAGYDLLDLITFFTTGETETRAWTIQKGSTAPVAGTAIHTDFKDKFIRAEVVFWEDLIESGSYAKARERGLTRTEGKEYVVKDGDVIEFRI